MFYQETKGNFIPHNHVYSLSELFVTKYSLLSGPLDSPIKTLDRQY